MQTLDLRGSASVEPPAPEEPPGLERVRRFIAPVGRFFHGVRLWVRFLWKAAAGFGKQAGPAIARAARATGRFAMRGERRARTGAAFLRALSRSGGRLRNTGRNWSRAGGRLGRFGARMSRAGQWTEDAASGSAELLLGVAAAARELKRLRGAPPGSGDGDRRLLPRAPSASPPGADPSSPPESAPAALPDRVPAPQPPEPSLAAESPSAEDRPSPSGTSPPAAERAGTAPPARRRPRRQQRPQSRPQPRPKLRPDPPDDLPYALRGEIVSLPERPPQARTRKLILEICAVREWVRPAELARWLGVGAANLTKRHLGPLTEQGLLERRYPESPRHRHQAYRTAKAPPPGGAAQPRDET